MSKVKGLSLFSSGGVAEAFLEDIGIDILIANEIDEKRAKFYQHIYPDTKMISDDITNNEVRDKIVNEAKENDIDFVIATPPCQGMSEAGKRLKFDPRNQLIYYAIDVIKRLKPKFVLLENVPQQLITKIEYDNELILIPEYIKKELGSAYKFNEDTIIMAKDHGVPQLRKRSIFLLVRNDLEYTWEFPEKQPEITLRDAIGHLPILHPKLREGLDMTLEKFPDFYEKAEEAKKISKWHFPPTHAWRHVNWMMHTPTGKSAIYNEEEYIPKKKDGTKIKAHHNNYRRQKWDMPSRTLTQNNGVISSLACVHPGRKMETLDGQTIYSDPRVLTIYELMIVSSLPLDWDIPEWATESFIRKIIGEGIPSRLVKNISLELVKQL